MRDAFCQSMIELIAFPGAPNLPVFVAREKGFFTEHELERKMAEIRKR